MACTWMLMGLLYMDWFDDYNSTWLSTADIDLDRDSLRSKYTQALYFSVTIMATIGFGDIVRAPLYLCMHALSPVPELASCPACLVYSGMT